MPNIAITRAKQSDLTELCGCINLENGYNIMYIVCIIIIIYCIVNNLNSENVLVRRHYNCVPQDSTIWLDNSWVFAKILSFFFILNFFFSFVLPGHRVHPFTLRHPNHTQSRCLTVLQRLHTKHVI